jgi:hypothetical protein
MSIRSNDAHRAAINQVADDLTAFRLSDQWVRRSEYIEAMQGIAQLDGKIAKLDDKLTLVCERQAGTLQRLDDQSALLNQLLGIFGASKRASLRGDGAKFNGYAPLVLIDRTVMSYVPHAVVGTQVN